MTPPGRRSARTWASCPSEGIPMGHMTLARTTAIFPMIGGLFLPGAAHAVDPYESAPPYGRPLDPAATLTPIITTGQQVALTGSSSSSTYRFVRNPDGLGAVGAGGAMTLLCNHEFSRGSGGPAGPLASGARVSELTIAYTTTPAAAIASARNYIAAVYAGEPPVLVTPGTARIARFCSAFMAGPAQGFDRPIFLHGEEASGSGTFDGQGGSAWATFDAATWQLRRLGHASWENVIALPGTGERTVILGLEDGSSSSQVYMYVGQKVPASTAPLERNGFSNGQLYVLAGENTAMNSEATFKVKGTSVGVRWASVNYAQNDDKLDTQSRAVGSFLFVRVEDGANDPQTPGDFYFVTTGRSGSANPFGRLYRLRLDPGNPLAPATSTLLLDGTEGIISPDNIDLNAHGELMICEDPTYNLSSLGLHRDSALWM